MRWFTTTAAITPPKNPLAWPIQDTPAGEKLGIKVITVGPYSHSAIALSKIGKEKAGGVVIFAIHLPIKPHTQHPPQGGVFYCLSRAGNTLCSRIEQSVTTETQMALLVLTELLTAIRAKDAQWFREWLQPRSTPLD